MQLLLPRLPAALLALGLALVSMTPALALSVRPPSFSELVAKADTILDGTVTAVESRWVTNAAGHRLIKTFVTVKARDVAKGEAAPEQTLVFLGGTVGRDTMAVGGMPSLHKGDRAWLFVEGNGHTVCPLLGAAHGAFPIRRDPATGQTRVARFDRRPLMSLQAIGTPFSDHDLAAADDATLTSQNEAAAPTGEGFTPSAFGAAVRAELERQRNLETAAQ